MEWTTSKHAQITTSRLNLHPLNLSSIRCCQSSFKEHTHAAWPPLNAKQILSSWIAQGLAMAQQRDPKFWRVYQFRSPFIPSWLNVEIPSYRSSHRFSLSWLSWVSVWRFWSVRDVSSLFVLLLRLKFVLFLFSCLLCLCLYRDALLLRLVECCCRFCRWFSRAGLSLWVKRVDRLMNAVGLIKSQAVMLVSDFKAESDAACDSFSWLSKCLPKR